MSDSPGDKSSLIRREQSSNIITSPPSVQDHTGQLTTEHVAIGHDSSPTSQSVGKNQKPSSPTEIDFVLLDHSVEKKSTITEQRSSDTFWVENGGISKGPGRAVMKLSRTVSQPPSIATSVPSSSFAMNSSNSNHKRNHSSSSKFEDFAKSCNDDWNSDIDQERPGAFTGISKPTTTISPQSISPSEPNPPRIAIGPGHPHPPSIFPPSANSYAIGHAPSHLRQTSASSNSHIEPQPMDPKLIKLKKLVLEDEVPDMNQVRTLAWSGIPSEVRPITWKLLLGYIPLIKSKRPQVLERKRSEYHHLVHSYYNNKSTNDEMWRQIHIDIPRMQPLISIFQQVL